MVRLVWTQERGVQYVIYVSDYLLKCGAIFCPLHPSVIFGNKRKISSRPEMLGPSPKGMFCLRSAWCNHKRCLLHNVSLHVKGNVAIVCIASGHLSLKDI